MTIINKNWVNECKESILIAFPYIGQEYIDEAEHQDGEEFWMNFESISQVLKDVQEYQAAADDDCISFNGLRKRIHHEADLLLDAMRTHETSSKVENVSLKMVSERAIEFPTIEEYKWLRNTYNVEMLSFPEGWYSETRTILQEVCDVRDIDFAKSTRIVILINDKGGIEII